jgi:tetratricopeptide (TPR) repeat protein
MRDVAATLLAAIHHQQAGRHAEADALYDAALTEHPDHPQARYLHGLLQLADGRPHAAARSLAQAASLRPAHLESWLYLGRAMLSLGRNQDALRAADRALACAPGHAQALLIRGTALNALRQPAESAIALRQAVTADPANAAAHLNLGNALADLDQLEAAETACCEALTRDPTLIEGWVSLGFILTARGRLPEAIAACESAIAMRPDCAQAHWNLGVAALLAGDYARGFAEYEWRKRHDRFRHDFIDLPGPVWSGDDPAGRTILVHAEQGFGDTIQFARYLPLLAARGARVILACDRSLTAWLAAMAGVGAAVARGQALPAYDAWIDQMSLPLAFRTRLDGIPAPDGYLAADPARAASWRAALPPGRKVGIAWAGNPLHTNDRRRSLPASLARRLCETAGATFINLQVGARANEIGLPDLSARLTDYAETAALVANLELVVTVDTSVAHVAGALGVPCWVMLPYAPDWRWGLLHDTSPWYASVRLFRQPEPGAWDDVVVRVRHALAAWPGE